MPVTVVLENNSVSLKFSLVDYKYIFFVMKRYLEAEGKFAINLYPVYCASIIATFNIKTLWYFKVLIKYFT